MAAAYGVMIYNGLAQESSGESDASFILDDGGGQAWDSAGTEMPMTRKDTWIRDGR